MQRRLFDERERLRWLRRSLVHPQRLVHDLSQRLDALQVRATRGVRSAPSEKRAALRALEARLYQHAPAIVVRASQVRAHQLGQRLRVAMHQQLSERRHRIGGLRRALAAIGPQQTLERGYAILTRQPGGRVLRNAADARTGEAIEARLARGRLRGVVREVLDE